MTCQSFAVTRAHEMMFDLELSKLACFKTNNELSLSPLLPANFVLAQHYVSSFPQHSILAKGASNSEESYLLSPTCCYPVFRQLANSEQTDPFLVTNKNTCFRNEIKYELGERQSAFLMREYIFFSTDLELVENWIAGVKEQVVSLLEKLGLTARVLPATDPFFNPNDLKQKFQVHENLKSEFVVESTAVGSVNLHLKSFSKSCNIRSPSGSYFYSACFGLGYDRVSAKLDQAAR